MQGICLKIDSVKSEKILSQTKLVHQHLCDFLEITQNRDKKLMVQRCLQPCQVVMSHMTLSFAQLLLSLTCFFSASDAVVVSAVMVCAGVTSSPPREDSISGVPRLAFQPSFLRPQRRMPTTVRSRQATGGTSEAAFSVPRCRATQASPSSVGWLEQAACGHPPSPDRPPLLPRPRASLGRDGDTDAAPAKTLWPQKNIPAPFDNCSLWMKSSIAFCLANVYLQTHSNFSLWIFFLFSESNEGKPGESTFEVTQLF